MFRDSWFRNSDKTQQGWLDSARLYLGPQLRRHKWLGTLSTRELESPGDFTFLVPGLGWLTVSLAVAGSFDWKACTWCVASSCGLGFLIAWLPQVIQTSYMVANSFKNKFFRKWPSLRGNIVYFYHTLLIRTHLDSRGNFTSIWEDYKLVPCIKTSRGRISIIRRK